MRQRLLHSTTFLAIAILSAEAKLVSAAPGDLDSLDLKIATHEVLATVEQADGKLIIAGGFRGILGTTRRYLARINVDGTLDVGFNPQPNGLIRCVAVQADGKILLAGSFSTFQPTGAPFPVTRLGIARLNADGTLDGSFYPEVGSIFCLAAQADGKILLGGSFTSIRPNDAAFPSPRNNIARLNPDGSLDSAFDPNPNARVYSIKVQPDDKLLLGGQFTTLQSNGSAAVVPRRYIARVHEDGTLDEGFDPSPNNEVHTVMVQADGKVLLGGIFQALQPNGAADSVPRNYIARMQADGTLDESFDPSPNNIVYTLALQTDGKVLLGGDFTSVRPNGAAEPTRRYKVARCNANGQLDPGFDPAPNLAVFSLAHQEDGRVLVGGIFTALYPNGEDNPPPRYGFARLLNDPATQILTAPVASKVSWVRGGSGLEISQVTFELSTDGGVTWTSLGLGTRVVGGWELTGLTLPVTGYLRARGRTSAGLYNGSSGVIEQVASFVYYPAWAATALPGAPEAERATGYDFDGDGKSNGWEFFMGSDPRVHETADLVHVVSSPGTVAFEYPRRRGLAVVETVQVSNTLADFRPLPPTEYTRELIDNGPGQPDTVRITIPDSAEPRRFFRIVVEM